MAGWLYQLPGSGTGSGTDVALLHGSFTNTTLCPTGEGSMVSWVNGCVPRELG